MWVSWTYLDRLLGQQIRLWHNFSGELVYKTLKFERFSSNLLNYFKIHWTNWMNHTNSEYDNEMWIPKIKNTNKQNKKQNKTKNKMKQNKTKQRQKKVNMMVLTNEGLTCRHLWHVLSESCFHWVNILSLCQLILTNNVNSLLFVNGNLIHDLLKCEQSILQYWKVNKLLCKIDKHQAYTLFKYLLTAHNWQKWKRVFLTCPCHKIYKDEALGLKSCKYTWKIMIFVKM